MRACVVVGLVLALACVALAGEEPKARPNVASGTFVSAELAAETIKWQLDLGADAGKKTYEMAAEIKVQYLEKEGVKQAQAIGAAAGRDFRELEGAVVAKGKFASAKLDGDKVTVTIALPEGGKTLDVVFPAKLMVIFRQDGEKLTAYRIGIARQRPARTN